MAVHTISDEPACRTHELLSITSLAVGLSFQPDDMPFKWDEAPELSRRRSPTTYIDALETQGVTFTAAYTVAPMCAPSRFGLITGRYPSRGLYAQDKTDECNGVLHETDVTVTNCKIDDDFDLQNNLPTAMQGLGYRTGQVGKWHLSKSGKSGSWDNYTYSQEQVRAAGFDYVDGLYVENLDDQDINFSHNMEVRARLYNSGRRATLPRARHYSSV